MKTNLISAILVALVIAAPAMAQQWTTETPPDLAKAVRIYEVGPMPLASGKDAVRPFTLSEQIIFSLIKSEMDRDLSLVLVIYGPANPVLWIGHKPQSLYFNNDAASIRTNAARAAVINAGIDPTRILGVPNPKSPDLKIRLGLFKSSVLTGLSRRITSLEQAANTLRDAVDKNLRSLQAETAARKAADSSLASKNAEQDQTLTDHERRLKALEARRRGLNLRVGSAFSGLAGLSKVRGNYRPDIGGLNVAITFAGDLGYVGVIGFGRPQGEGYYEIFGAGLVGFNPINPKWLSLFLGYGIGGGKIELDGDSPTEKHHGFIFGARATPKISKQLSLDFIAGYMADEYRLAKSALAGVPGEKKFDFKNMPALLFSAGLTVTLN